MLAQAAAWLSRNASAIDAINVFPVPDGDTGSNMSLTLEAAVAAAGGAGGRASEVLQRAARGALMGARGNSGVILSQILRGLADGAFGADTVDAPALAAALRSAAATASRAVDNPIEGTILTVLDDVAADLSRGARPGMTLAEFFAAAVETARRSVARTPDLLPILKEAGVVDSGGLGLCVIFEGCLLFLRGEELPPLPAGALVRRTGAPQPQGERDARFGYCTEFLIEGSDLDVEAIKADVKTLGESILVVGEPALVHVHLHTSDPGPALSLGVGLGSLSQIKIENMDAQHRAQFQATAPASTGEVSVVAVALGAGFEQILRDYGATVVRGGQTMNPSTEAILEAIERCCGAAVILLPNHKNVVLTAQQAASLAGKPVTVLAARTVPQGIAAALAFRPEAGIEANTAAMTEAAGAVRTIEVTRAAHALRIEGAEVRGGQPIGLIDGEPATTGAAANDAALAAIELLMPAAGALTVYYGRDLPHPQAEALGAEIERRWPGVEVQVVSGGQPFYDYTISVE